MLQTPLAEQMRPKSFDEIVGQERLFGKNGVLRRMCESGRLTNMIFFGPPGTGKTTAAALIAGYSDMRFCRLNATTASLSDVKEVLSSSNTLFGNRGTLLYIDEIQYFNRKQQQALLEYIEDGRVTLVASTTENPHFYVYNALISRSTLFEFKPVTPAEITKALRRALDYLNRITDGRKTAEDAILTAIAETAGGDVRRALMIFENAYYNAADAITREDVTAFDGGVRNYSDDAHFDLMSALQKSIRGSDPDAAVFYLCRLLAAGELLAACRRLQVMASEDVGLAYPLAAAVTRACCESARELGMPEARIPLSHAAILLATAPKSNSANAASEAAMADIEAGYGMIPPPALRSPLFKGYRYPHDYPGHYVKQQYLPDDIKERIYYRFGQNKTEQAAAAYAAAVGSLKKESSSGGNDT
ncbi:MAG: replication-associated recombination protein A [Clostridia bacterium]|nr:replication-associated recombination protein A [Clostridia bacterium]